MPKAKPPVEFTQIAALPDGERHLLYALDKYGRVWACAVSWSKDGPDPDWYAIDAPEDD